MSGEDGDEYKVGPGRPPKHTRFKPGQSGNPRGRPKRVSNLIAAIERELMRLVTITKGGQSRRVTRSR